MDLPHQQLTDYALNALEARERAYTETMLAASEEARHDVVQTIEVARLLEQGFEREGVTAELAELGLTPQQRAVFARPIIRWSTVVRDAGTGLAVAACVALVIGRLQSGGMPEGLTRVSAQLSSAGPDLRGALAALAEKGEDDPSAGPTADPEALPEPTIICTPPAGLLDSYTVTRYGTLSPARP